MQSDVLVCESNDLDWSGPLFERERRISKWESNAENRAIYGSFVAMVGGPVSQHLPEHEHPDLQLSIHFGKRTSTKIVASAEPHSGGRDDGEKVVVLLLSSNLLGEVTEDLAYCGCAEIQSQNGYTLAGHVVRAYARLNLREANGELLTSKKLTDLSDFIDGTLGQTIGISDLASRVNLPPRRFADSFKNTTGLTPVPIHCSSTHRICKAPPSSRPIPNC